MSSHYCLTCDICHRPCPMCGTCNCDKSDSKVTRLYDNKDGLKTILEFINKRIKELTALRDTYKFDPTYLQSVNHQEIVLQLTAKLAAYREVLAVLEKELTKPS